jgi:hypothetical protein
MKKALLFIVIAVLAYGYTQNQGLSLPDPTRQAGADHTLQDAFAQKKSDVQVRGQGTVSRVLRDDLDGSRHQKFILRLDSGQSILISHNIDLAPRVNSLSQGDTVEFFGEYEWNSKGGVIHWTHHDPNRRHVDGWLKHRGTTYE